MDSLFKDLSLTTDPVWPWNLPGVGWVALALAALVLLGAAAWSYSRVPAASPRRVAVLIGLRALALGLVFLALAGVSCVSRDEMKVPSLVLVGLDASESMKVNKDERGQARWDALMRTLRQAQPVIDRLRAEHNIQLVFFTFGDKVETFDPDNPGTAEGKYTDTAELLSTLLNRYRGERYLRGLLILSDGADNVASDPPARMLAAQFRGLACPVHTFAFGSETTTLAQNDVVVRNLATDPVVAVKGKLTVRATIDAPGFINAQARAHLEFNGKEVAAQDEVLRLRKDNEIVMVVDAPPTAGEIEVTFKIQAPGGGGFSGEINGANNQMSTFVTVSGEGIRVLLVDRLDHTPEMKMIAAALSGDKRIRADVAWLTGGEALTPEQKDLFQFDQQPYDVIILGDVTAARLKQADARALQKLHERVIKNGAGLMMLGGRYTVGPDSDWGDTPVSEIMPVQLPFEGQDDRLVKLRPRPEEVNHFVLRQGAGGEETTLAWEKLYELNGITLLGERRANARVLAETPGGKPLLVARDVGTGRTMVLGADTTNLWIKPKHNGKAMHHRFWQHVVLWLAHREETRNNLQVRPDIRRLPTGAELKFGVELSGGQGEELRDTRYQVKVKDPKGNEVPVEVAGGVTGARTPSEHRGSFKPRLEGVYEIVATGEGKDAKGKEVKSDGPTVAHIRAYQDDAETKEAAANHRFLSDLARDGGGQEYLPGDLRGFLDQLPTKPLANPPPRPSKFPDWRADRGRSPFLVAFFLLFVQVLTLEWFLRRRWGLV